MSTEHPSPHDVEYGPNPPGAKHEHTDIDPSIGYKFAAWLTVAVLISVVIVYGTFWFFEGRARTADQALQRYPLAVGQTRQPPAPNLQTQPFKDVYLLRHSEAERLGSYGWVDKEGGVARIPIDRAMALTLNRLPARPDGGDGQATVAQDSSAGRTKAPR